MEAKRMLIKALERSKEERGMRVSKPNDLLSSGHMKKALHNLVVMTDLSRLGHGDWVVITAYYAMYQSALALLSKIGLESKDHAATVAALECLFGREIGRELLGKFDRLKHEKDKIDAITIDGKFISYMWKLKRARENVQYGVSIGYSETDDIMKSARVFVNKARLVISELDGQILELIGRKINEIKKLAEV